MRIVSKDNFNNTYKFRNDEFKIEDIILIFNSAAVINILVSKKFNYRWIRLYRITKSDLFKEIYKVSELNDAIFWGTYVNNRLKHFYAAMILDVFSRHGASASSDNRDSDIVNFANTFQGEDLDVKNLAFEKEDRNNKIEDEDGVIEDEE